MFSSLFVCLFVCLLATLRKSFQTDLFCKKFSEKVGNGPMNNWLNFGGGLDHRLGYKEGRRQVRAISTSSVRVGPRSGLPLDSVMEFGLYRDCFLDSSLLGDMENGINRLRCATVQCRACTSRHRHSNYDIITSPAAHDRQPDWYRDTGKTCLGGGMHCPSASSFVL